MLDRKLTVYQATKLSPYPLPRIEDNNASSTGGQLLTAMNLKKAYYQVTLGEGLRDDVTIKTNCGLYRQKRLMFGVSSALVVSQCLIDAPMIMHTLEIFL